MVKRIIYRGQSANELFGRREELAADAEEAVKRIVNDVRQRGDSALIEYNAKFDGFSGSVLRVEKSEFDDAFNAISPAYIAVLKRSIANIEKFHGRQKRGGFEIDEGDRIVGQKVTPVSRAGIYVPGGTAAYPSTVLMNAIPAKIAGVGEIVMCTPVKTDGKVRPEILVAAALCGVDKVFKAGGAQAIAALAYGTESIPRADVIAGPGNIYVATAKKLVSGIACGIDMVAGPSEILVVADGGADPVHIAADLLSQAEHDKVASALLMTDSLTLADGVERELERQINGLPRRDIAQASLERNCRIIVADDLETAVNLANEYAPEHLELCVKDAKLWLDKIKNAGSVFLGYDTPEAVGDYFAGANHTLPTSGTARFASPLSVDDFVKTTQYVYYTRGALEQAADDIIAFARSEGLTAHGESVAVRVRK